MKFLLELMTWCGSASLQSAQPRPEEARSLVILSPPRQPAPRYHGRKRRRASAARSKPEADWRPSLFSISEDNDAQERGNRSLAGTERTLRRKVGSTTTPIPAAGVKHRSYSDDLGRNGFSAMMPAFSPTPFLF